MDWIAGNSLYNSSPYMPSV